MPAAKKQSQPASLPSSPICLSLQKFSSTIVPRNSVGPLPWTHLSSHGDLFAIFDTVRTVRSDASTYDSKRFKILRDPDVLEDLDLDLLASESKRAIEMARDASDHNKDHNVAVIKKIPVIAVKYPISDGQVKRFQIRFRADPDFYEALKQMANVGVHMLEAGTFPSHRAQEVPRSNVHYIPRVQQSAQMMTRSSTPVISALDPVASVHMPPPPNPTTARVYASDLQYFREPKIAQSQAETDLPKATDVAPTATISPLRTPEHVSAVDMGIHPLLNEKAAFIDLYTPRPSTAPAQVSQHLSQILPPPRDLPFKSTSNAVKRKAKAETAAITEQKCGAKNNEGEAQIETIIPDSQEAPGSQSSAKRVGIAIGKDSSKTPTAKRQKRDPAYKCDACKAKGPRSRCRHKRSTPQLPSIEEVFIQNAAAAEQRGEAVKEIDTQTLLNRSAATKKHKRASKATLAVREPARTSRITRSMSIAARKSDAVPNPAEPAAAPITGEPPPCTPANQLMGRVLTPKSPVPSTTTADKAPSGSTRVIVQPPVAGTIVPPAQDAANQPLSKLAALLEAHPIFTKANSKLDRFATLTSQQQDEMLKGFVLEQTGNQGFKVLCETMERALSVGLGVGLWAAV